MHSNKQYSFILFKWSVFWRIYKQKKTPLIPFQSIFFLKLNRYWITVLFFNWFTIENLENPKKCAESIVHRENCQIVIVNFRRNIIIYMLWPQYIQTHTKMLWHKHKVMLQVSLIFVKVSKFYIIIEFNGTWKKHDLFPLRDHTHTHTHIGNKRDDGVQLCAQNRLHKKELSACVCVSVM